MTPQYYKIVKMFNKLKIYKKHILIGIFILLFLFINNLISFAEIHTCDPYDRTGDQIHSHGIYYSKEDTSDDTWVYPDGLCFPSFNNFIYPKATGNFKDERYFLKASKTPYKNPTKTSDVDKNFQTLYDPIDVTVGQKISIVAFIHNDGDTRENDSGKTKAKNVETYINKIFTKNEDGEFVTTNKTSFNITQYISSSNADPRIVDDQITIKSTNGKKIRLKYIKNTIRNQLLNKKADGTYNLLAPVYYNAASETENFFNGSGVPLGSPKYKSTEVWACSPYINYFFFDVEVIAEEEEKPDQCEYLQGNFYDQSGQDPYISISTNPEYKGTFVYKTANGGYFKNVGDNKQHTSLTTSDRKIRYFPAFGSTASVNATDVANGKSCKKDFDFICKDLDFTSPPDFITGANTLEVDVDPYDQRKDSNNSNYYFYQKPEITWKTGNNQGCFKNPTNPSQCTTSLTGPYTKVEFQANNNTSNVTVTEKSNPSVCKDTLVRKKEEEKKVCEDFRLNALDNIYEGTYPNTNTIALSVNNFQPPEYASEVNKGNITFYWSIDNVNAAFYGPNGIKLPYSNSEKAYYTNSTVVTLQGTIEENDKIQVWEETIKSAPCKKSITVKPKEEIKKCENLILKSPTNLAKQGTFYILPKTDQQLIFEMTVIGNYRPNDLQINTSFGSPNQYVNKCSSTFPNFCYNYNGNLPTNENITFSDPKNGDKCYVPFKSEPKIVEPDKCIKFSKANPPSINKDVNNNAQEITFNYEKTSGYTLTFDTTPSSYLNFINCTAISSETGTCKFQYSGGYTGTNLSINDRVYPNNCNINIPLTKNGGPGGEDKCIKFSKPIPSSIDKDVNNYAQVITFDYEKTSNYDLNFKLDPESHLSKISCTPESNTSANSGTCKFQYSGGYTGTNLSINDRVYPNNCNINIPLRKNGGPGGEICTIDEIRDQYGNKVTALAPNTTAKLQISGTNLLNNKLTWQFLNNSKNISTSVGTFQNNQAEFDSYILPGQVTAITKTQRGTLKVAGTDTRGTPCVREIPVLAMEERCIDLTILPEAKYLPFIPAGTTMNLSWKINPPYLTAPSWYVTPPEAGKIAQINAAGKYVTLETYGEGKVVAIYLDDSDRCYDERPIKKEFIHEREFNDEIKKIANPSTINTKIIEAGGTEVINYTVEYFLNVDPNPITQITFIDTISGTGEIHGRGNNANKLVYNNNEKYYVYDKNGNSLSTTISGKLVDSGGITFSNLPVETHKIKITYEMLAKPEYIKVDCTSNICGEAFPNTVLRRIPGIDDKYANAKVYYLCPYLLTRNGGEVFFEEEFIYGADVSCIDNTVRNTTGIAFIEREKKEEPKIIDTGPNNDWIRNASFCDNEYQNPATAQNNKVISRFSSYICEIKTKFIDPWRKPFVYALMTENQERILRNYKPIERGINTILSLSNNEFTLLQAFSKNPNPQKNILYFDGNKLNNKKLILGTGFRDLEIENGAKTIVLTNGDLIIKDNIVYKIPASSEFLTYQNNHKEIPSIAFIVVNGNIYIDPKVEKIQGIFYVQQKDSNTGQLKASNEEMSYQQLTIRGSVLGDIQPLFKKRKYIGPASMDGGAIVIRYDERVLLNTPPGIEQYLDMDWLKSAKTSE